MMRLRLAQPMARAPPEPPSPITTDRIGTRKPNISLKLTAIASPCKGDSLPHQAMPASDANALYLVCRKPQSLGWCAWQWSLGWCAFWSWALSIGAQPQQSGYRKSAANMRISIQCLLMSGVVSPCFCRRFDHKLQKVQP